MTAKSDPIRTAYKRTLDAAQSVKGGIHQYESFLNSLRYRVMSWRNLPDAIATERATLGNLRHLEADYHSFLTKPLADYETKRKNWRNRGRAEYQNPKAQAAQRATTRREQCESGLAALEAELSAGYRAYILEALDGLRESIQRKETDTREFWQAVMDLARLLAITEPYSAKELQEAFNAWAQDHLTAKEKRETKREQAAEKIIEIPARANPDGTLTILQENMVKALQPFDRHRDFVIFLGTTIACRVDTVRDLFCLLADQVTLKFTENELIARSGNSLTHFKAVHVDNKGAFARIQLAPLP